MKVSLLDYTGAGHSDPMYAANVLIFAKNTRVKMGPDGFKAISEWPMKKKMDELEYIANTIKASWEFVDYTFMLEEVTRAFTHQFVRHRTCSFAQQTMQILNVKGFTTEKPVFEDEKKNTAWDYAVRTISDTYDFLIENGATVEQARGLLPTNIHTNIVAKMNLRTLIDIVHTRISPRNLGEASEAAKAMRDEVMRVHPWTVVFFHRTVDNVTTDLDVELKDLREREPEKATRMLKLVDQIRREG